MMFDMNLSRSLSFASVSSCYILYSVDTASCKINLGLALMSIPDIAFLISVSNQMTTKAFTLSSYSIILLIVSCSAELHCPHNRPKRFSILLLNVYFLKKNCLIRVLWKSLSIWSAVYASGLGLYLIVTV